MLDVNWGRARHTHIYIYICTGTNMKCVKLSQKSHSLHNSLWYGIAISHINDIESECAACSLFHISLKPLVVIVSRNVRHRGFCLLRNHTLLPCVQCNMESSLWGSVPNVSWEDSWHIPWRYVLCVCASERLLRVEWGYTFRKLSPPPQKKTIKT